ncbi:MAG: four helix bundle protein [Clostridia bacterium]|nr:four helix bundle protein [Clostridia bacterium]
MKRNLLLEYSEQLASEIAELCRNCKPDSNTTFQIKKSSSSVFANITEAQYPQSLADMHSKLEIARKECAETESWLRLIFASGIIDEPTFKTIATFVEEYAGCLLRRASLSNPN